MGVWEWMCGCVDVGVGWCGCMGRVDWQPWFDSHMWV